MQHAKKRTATQLLALQVKELAQHVLVLEQRLENAGVGGADAAAAEHVYNEAAALATRLLQGGV